MFVLCVPDVMVRVFCVQIRTFCVCVMCMTDIIVCEIYMYGSKSFVCVLCV